MARICYHGDPAEWTAPSGIRDPIGKRKYIGCPGKADDVHIIPKGQRAALCNDDSMNWPTAPKHVSSRMGATCPKCLASESLGAMMQSAQRQKKARAR